ncbi:hypothetical protein VPHD148_0177 [Vibrio phage D148]
MTTLIEKLDEERRQMRIEARNAKITGDGDPAYYEAKADGLYAAMDTVKKFTADNADCIDAQQAVLIEKLIGDK